MLIKKILNKIFDSFSKEEIHIVENKYKNIKDKGLYYEIKMDNINVPEFNAQIDYILLNDYDCSKYDNFSKQIIDCYMDYYEYFIVQNKKKSIEKMLYFQDRINEVWYHLNGYKHVHYWIEIDVNLDNDEVKISIGNRRFIAYKLFMLRHFYKSLGYSKHNLNGDKFRIIKRYKRKQELLKKWFSAPV